MYTFKFYLYFVDEKTYTMLKVVIINMTENKMFYSDFFSDLSDEKWLLMFYLLRQESRIGRHRPGFLVYNLT